MTTTASTFTEPTKWTVDREWIERADTIKCRELEEEVKELKRRIAFLEGLVDLK